MSLRIGVLLLVAIASGCGTYSQLDVEAEALPTVLTVGDTVLVERVDNTSELIVIDRISSTHISGSVVKGYPANGREVSISFDEISSVSIYEKPSLESELPYVVVGAILAMITVDAIFSD